VKGGPTIIGNGRHHALEQMLEGVALARGQAVDECKEH
jgi:hypothetical protein